jgi:hypothetical protein
VLPCGEHTHTGLTVAFCRDNDTEEVESPGSRRLARDAVRTALLMIVRLDYLELGDLTASQEASGPLISVAGIELDCGTVSAHR